MDTRKRKRVFRPSLSLVQHYSSLRILIYFSLFLLLLFMSHSFGVGSGGFRPARIVPNLSVFSSSISNSVQDLSTHHVSSVTVKTSSGSSSRRSSSNGLALEVKLQKRLPLELEVENRVLFTDLVLVILSINNGRYPFSSLLGHRIDCVYQKLVNGSSNGYETEEIEEETFIHPMLSADEYHQGRWIVRCPFPPANFSAAVGLKGHRDDVGGLDWVVRPEIGQKVQLWDMVAYDAALDGEDTAVVFVKGLNLKSDRESDSRFFSCYFRAGNSDKKDVYNAKAITASQEVIRCSLPEDLKTKLRNNEGVDVTVERTFVTVKQHQLIPSIAKLYPTTNKVTQKYKLCACTMVWNQAAFIKEWVTYHTWLGIQRWFVYDNNSDDGLKDVIDELNSENYTMSRHAWPWVKSQEAGFSHCVLRARDECDWVAFFDVDEFYYFAPPKENETGANLNQPGPDTLRAVVEKISSASPSVGEIRTDCLSFGPSGLKRSPEQGLTLGYTCRLRNPERHKSIVRPDAVDDTLLNQVHHFRLKKEFRRKDLPRSRAVINHYKYQVWDVFKAKFYRRVSTYVVDWQENQNENSRDRAPGLGTEAIEPPNWPRRFCEVWDTRLRDFVLANFADPKTGLLPWQRSFQAS